MAKIRVAISFIMEAPGLKFIRTEKELIDIVEPTARLLNAESISNTRLKMSYTGRRKKS